MDVFAMDTYMDLRVSAPDGDALLREASARITELEKTLSVTQPDSDISRINAAGGSPVPVSSDTAAILREALDIGAESGGALDITIYPLLRAWGFTTDTQQVPSGEEIASLWMPLPYRLTATLSPSRRMPCSMWGHSPRAIPVML